MKPDVDILAKKARSLNFSHRVLGSGRHQVLFKSSTGALTGKGYTGSIDGCLAYLQGWQEHESTAQT